MATLGKANEFQAKVALSNLTTPEKMILLAIRRWLENERNWPLIAAEFEAAMGPEDAARALDGLAGFLEVVSSHARRTLWFRRPLCSSVTHDERSLLAFLGACQQDAEDHANALLCHLIPPVAHRAAWAHAGLLARTLKGGGLPIPLPRPGRVNPLHRALSPDANSLRTKSHGGAVKPTLVSL